MAMMAVGIGLTLVAGIMQAEAEKKRGESQSQLAHLNAANAKTAAQYKAEGLQSRATRRVAEGIIKGREQKRRADYAASRATALAGASGTNLIDPDIINTLAGFEEKGTLNFDREVYKGNLLGREDELMAGAAIWSGMSQADALIFEGDSYLEQGKRQADATLVGTAGSVFNKYSSGRQSGMFEVGSNSSGSTAASRPSNVGTTTIPSFDWQPTLQG